MALICPNCRVLLVDDNISYRCPAGHTFDKAKSGYTNLLLANQKKTLDPGDSKQMIRSRELFLIEGYYDFLIEDLKLCIERTHSDNLSNTLVLDIGCGSGYYTRRLLQNNKAIQKIGLDISKNSVEAAAKKDKKTVYLVASAFNLPIASKTTDFIINIFSPLDLKEAIRVLKDNGSIIKVIPGANHMKEIALLVYDEFKPHHTNFKKEIKNSEQLEITDDIEINQKVKLNKNSLLNMINMTPYKYKFTEEQIDKLESMEVTISFQILVVNNKLLLGTQSSN